MIVLVAGRLGATDDPPIYLVSGRQRALLRPRCWVHASNGTTILRCRIDPNTAAVVSSCNHVTLHRWVQRFTPLLVDAARPCRHAGGRRWFVDETYVKVAGVWRYMYRAVDGYGQVIDVYVSVRRDIAAARTFFTTAIAAHGEPEEVVTDRAAPLANVIEELLPQALHNTIK